MSSVELWVVCSLFHSEGKLFIFLEAVIHCWSARLSAAGSCAVCRPNLAWFYAYRYSTIGNTTINFRATFMQKSGLQVCRSRFPTWASNHRDIMSHRWFSSNILIITRFPRLSRRIPSRIQNFFCCTNSPEMSWPYAKFSVEVCQLLTHHWMNSIVGFEELKSSMFIFSQEQIAACGTNLTGRKPSLIRAF